METAGLDAKALKTELDKMDEVILITIMKPIVGKSCYF